MYAPATLDINHALPLQALQNFNRLLRHNNNNPFPRPKLKGEMIICLTTTTMAAISLSDALRMYGLLDTDGYLVSPDNPNVANLTRKMASLMELQADGLRLTLEDKQRLKTMHMVFDYYNEALQDLENDLMDDSEVDEDDDDTEDEDQDDDH